MQSRLWSTATRFHRVFFTSPHNQSLPPRTLASFPTRCHGDPAIHSETYDGRDPEEEAVKPKPSQEDEPFVPPSPPYPPSPKLTSTGVNQPVEPTIQQKRRNSTVNPPPIGDVSCAGLDGTQWPEGGPDWESKQEEDDREYFQHRKASPLAEIEVVDTRKPITRVTDGTADSYEEGGREDVILWRPEQLDTAEDSLRRAMEIWRESAMRGDPDSPHGRVLRALRGEDW